MDNNTTSVTNNNSYPCTPMNHPLARAASSIVYENGTLVGAVSATSLGHNSNIIIPEIVISPSYSSQSLNRSRAWRRQLDPAIEESTALLAQSEQGALPPEDEFESFVLNRSTSESNILESSIYSELQFAPATTTADSQAQQATPQTPLAGGASVLNTSTCSRESRQNKRTRRKHKSKSKCTSTSAVRSTPVLGGSGTVGAPPQYTAIFLDSHPHLGQTAATAMANAAASSPFLNGGDVNSYMQQQYQYFQQRPLLTNAVGHHLHHR